jgi:DNA-binding MarR family transcriptional regulator
MTSLRLEIIQERPFSSVQEEAFLSLLRTADCLHRNAYLKTRDWGLTSTQYNVLRILRGAGEKGLTCSAIGERMITAVPDITRLLNRLKASHLVTQQRDAADRRIVWTRITPAGLELLQSLDPVTRQMTRELLGHMPEGEINQLIALLEKARQPYVRAIDPMSTAK